MIKQRVFKRHFVGHLGVGITLVVALLPVKAQETAPLSPADLEKRFGKTIINLPAGETTVREAYSALLKQAGQSMGEVGSLGRTEKVTPQIENLPFWKAVFNLQEATGIGLFHGGPSSNGPLHYSLVYGPRVGGLPYESGPIIGMIKRATRTKTNVTLLNFDKPSGKNTPRENSGNSDELKINGEIYLDPKIPLIAGTPRLEIMEAKDENGAMLIPAGSLARGGDVILPFTIAKTITGDAPLPRKISSLKVNYQAFVALDTQTLAWDDVAVGQKKPGQRGGEIESYQILEAGQKPIAYNVKLRADRVTDGLDDRDVMETLFQNVRLLDGAGKEWLATVGSSGARSGISNPAKVRAFEASLSFGRGETLNGPFKLIWTLPSTYTSMNATLEWKDVPLPTPGN